MSGTLIDNIYLYDSTNNKTYVRKNLHSNMSDHLPCMFSREISKMITQKISHQNGDHLMINMSLRLILYYIVTGTIYMKCLLMIHIQL